MIVNDINNALDNKSYLSALSLALTLPDVCGKAEYPEKNTGERYKLWYDEHIGKYETFEGDTEPFLSGEVIYSLRNSFLHQATPNINKAKIKLEQNKIDKFILVLEPTNQFSIYGDSSITGLCEESQYFVSVQRLCFLLTTCALRYYNENRAKFNFFDYEIKYMK